MALSFRPVGYSRIQDAQTRDALRSVNTILQTLVSELEIIRKTESRVLPAEVTKANTAGASAVPDVTEVTGHVGGEGVPAGTLATGDDLDDVPDGATHGKVAGAELSSAQVIRIRRTGGGGANLDADDISRQDEVQSHIGGLSNTSLRDGTTTIIDVANQEYEVGTVLDAVVVGTSPDGETADRIRAGVVRAMNAIDSTYHYAGDIEEGITGTSDGVSTWGINMPGDGSDIFSDSGAGGGGGTGEGGQPDP